MSDLTRDDVIEMLQGIFEGQRNMTDEERQAYYDMLRAPRLIGRSTPRKGNGMFVLTARRGLKDENTDG